MPATSIRDLVIKDDDVVVGTHGRSFWILDNISPLRQYASDLANKEAFLYKPQTTHRIRFSHYTDTPVPQEEPAGQNPPDGAIIDYWLKDKTTGEVKLEIIDASGKLIRAFSSLDQPYSIPDLNIPLYWIRPQQILSNEAGSHRFLWDFHYKPLDVPPSFPISAVYQNTAPDATAPWALPGVYTAKLTANGKIFTENFTLKMDPRVKTSAEKLKQQHDLSLVCYEGRQKTMRLLAEIKTVKDKTKEMTELENNLGKINRAFTATFNILHDTDAPATSQCIAAVKENQKGLEEILNQYKTIKK
jgi:hypothetical protein